MAGNLEMPKIDENLDNLAKVLGAEPFDKRLADFLGQELVQRLRKAAVSRQASCNIHSCSDRVPYRLECLVNNAWMLEMIVGVEVELVQEVPDINTAQRVHLRKRENTGEPDK